MHNRAAYKLHNSFMLIYIEYGTDAIYTHHEYAANEKGYATMYYPSLLTCSTVGGLLAHWEIGVISTKYEKIDDMVLGMEVDLLMVIL